MTTICRKFKCLCFLILKRKMDETFSAPGQELSRGIDDTVVDKLNRGQAISHSIIFLSFSSSWTKKRFLIA